ncbi:MAG: thiamine phosphate synthase [Acidobacteriota bacterium]
MSSSPPSLYGLADADALGGVERVPDAAVAMAEAGIGWIQLRLKSGTDRQRLDAVTVTARRFAALPAMSTRTLWIDDRADLVALARPDASHGPRLGLQFGLHLGQGDLPPDAARRIVGDEVVIGRSCHDLDQIREADADPSVDVVAYGPVFTTRSKTAPDPTVGLDGVRAARAGTAKPLVAIGGIDADNARHVLDAGADTVAVIGALCRRHDVGAASHDFLAALDGRSNP